jgi:hypothetical protein
VILSRRLLLALSASIAAAEKSIEDTIQQIESWMNSKNYYAAKQHGGTLYSNAIQALAGVPPRATTEQPPQGADVDIARTALSRIKAAAKANQNVEIFKASLILLNALTKLEQQHSPERRVANAVNFYAASGKVQTLDAFREIMVVAYEAKRFKEAESYALKIVNSKSPVPPPKLLASSNVVLGLIHFSTGNRTEASTYLMNSAKQAVAASGPNAVPPLALAESMLAASYTEPLKQYLTLLAGGNWSPIWKRLLQKYAADLQAGTLKTFKPAAILY